MTTIKDWSDAYLAPTYSRFPVELVSGRGSLVWDSEGKRYIDLGTGIAVNTFGYSDETWAAAVTAQLRTLQHASNLYYTEPCAALAKLLCEKSGMKRVFFSNSGAEANECAIKAARKYAAERKGAEYDTIITLKNSFHGRTVTTLSATGQEMFHQLFRPLTPGFAYAEPNDLADMKRLVRENRVAAILFELVQGEGGVVTLEQSYVDGLAELAREEDILLAVDEVQTGNGRSGSLYAYMRYGFTPDIVSTAKGLAGGLPLGATLLGEKTQTVFAPGDHGSTFGGNPVCCAGALSVLERLDDELLAGVRERSQLVRDTLSGAPGIRGVDGLGLLLGVRTEKKAAQVAAECLQQGVLVLTAKEKVRLLPALNIPTELLTEALVVIRAVCAG